MNDETSPTNRLEGDDGDPSSQAAGEPTEPTAQQPRRLTRSSSDRVLLGVSGGLGRYFGVDPLLFRIGFAISLFFGGLGALAYLLLAIFVPTDGDPDRAQRLGGRLRRMGFWRGLGIAALVLLAFAGLVALAGGAAFAVAIGGGVPVGIVIIVVGAILALTAFRGRGARWVIPPLLALVVGGGVAAASDLDLRGGIGEREHHPLSASAIPSNGYKLGVGHLVADLRGLDWNADQTVRLKVRLGAGQADVIVPERVCVVGSTHVGIGESEVVGERNDGVDVDHTAGGGSSAEPRLEIDAKVDVGQLRVINSDTANVSDYYGRGAYDIDLAPLKAAERKACATA